MDLCNPSPCGPNTDCNEGKCTCLLEYKGDPYEGCRPECVLNTDCPLDKACLRNKCVDPCVGTCGQNALCNIYNHIPMCTCPIGMTGNAFLSCLPFRGKHKFDPYLVANLRRYSLQNFFNIFFCK